MSEAAAGKGHVIKIIAAHLVHGAIVRETIHAGYVHKSTRYELFLRFTREQQIFFEFLVTFFEYAVLIVDRRARFGQLLTGRFQFAFAYEFFAARRFFQERGENTDDRRRV